MISQSHRTTITEQTGILVTEILQIPFSPRLLPDSSHPGVFQVIKHFERSTESQTDTFLMSLHDLIVYAQGLFSFL